MGQAEVMGGEDLILVAPVNNIRQRSDACNAVILTLRVAAGELAILRNGVIELHGVGVNVERACAGEDEVFSGIADCPRLPGSSLWQ